MNRPNNINSQRQSGVAMIEMVVVTPVLLLLLLGVGELGKALVQYNILTKSVRDAARQVSALALRGTTGTVLLTADIQADARNLVVYGNTGGTGSPKLPGLAVGQVSISDAGNNYVLVRADYPYMPITGPALQTFGFGSKPAIDITLTATISMRAL